MNVSSCSICKNKAVYRRLYSGESLCADCFKLSIVEKTKRTISKYNMLRYGDRIAVSVSGGKDSLSLLHIMNNISKNNSTKLHAICVDEGISGYRDEAIRLTKDFTEALDIPLTIVSYEDLYGVTLDEALEWRGERKTSSCSICGVFRRRAIDIAAKKVDANVVATGHNLDDFLQTYLINLFSGDLAKIGLLNPALISKNDFSSRRVKPFMEIYEQEIALYAYLSNIPFQSTNCPHMNEGMRSDIRIMLNDLEAKHPGIKYSALKTTLGTAQGISFSDRKSISKCEKCGNPSSSKICSVCKTIQLIKINK